jgi:hypothetical protein
MPNWKKVIVSGSNAILNHITASGNISASGTFISKSKNLYNLQLYINGSLHILVLVLTAFM